MTKDADLTILELALKEVTLALDALIAECIGADGLPVAPSRQSLMRSKGLLPSYCEQSLKKRKEA